MKVLTVGTPFNMANEPGPEWTIVCCQFCGERMYCLEKNSKVNPGDELVLCCVKCLSDLQGVPESNPWSDEWK